MLEKAITEQKKTNVCSKKGKRKKIFEEDYVGNATRGKRIFR